MARDTPCPAAPLARVRSAHPAVSSSRTDCSWVVQATAPRTATPMATTSANAALRRADDRFMLALAGAPLGLGRLAGAYPRRRVYGGARRLGCGSSHG